MYAPFFIHPTLEEFTAKVIADFGCVLNHLEEIRFLYRELSDGTIKVAVLPNIRNSEVLTIDVIQSLCALLVIDLREIFIGRG